MKILHTSDLHFGINLCGVSLFENQRCFADMLIAEAKKADAVIIAGDVFDSSVANSEAISLYNYLVTKICGELKTAMCIIAGNHDGAARLGMSARLLEKSRLFVRTKLEGIKISPISFKDCDIYCIPYFNVSEVAGARSCEHAYMMICDEIRKNMDKSRKNIVVAHAFVNGSVICESDRAASVGGAMVVSKDVFNGFDYVALGHLHRPQELGGNIVYSGSPVKYSFGEANQEKHIVLYDTQTDEKTYVRVEQKHEMRVVKGTFEELLDTENYTEDYVKVIITDKNTGLTVIDELRNVYPNMLTVVGRDGTEKETETSEEELQTMLPKDLLCRYMDENFEYEPTDRQVKMFEEAVNGVWEEDRE